MQNKIRQYARNGLGSSIFVVSYHDFFHRNDAVLPLISGFLKSRSTRPPAKARRRMSEWFEREKRLKAPITEEQAAFVREHNDRAAEEWIMGRLDKRWRALEFRWKAIEATVGSFGGTPAPLANALLNVSAEATRRSGEPGAWRSRTGASGRGQRWGLRGGAASDWRRRRRACARWRGSQPVTGRAPNLAHLGMRYPRAGRYPSVVTNTKGGPAAVREGGE